ncbi:uncharacterized protein CEXT_702031 [Caerostris extrusa]|uniref:Uncharacterized protein n=1 Tax=Caerostris extrusa TaxID=172846 RepID=A0AAV4RSS6_CAEEX|nr:uncharacterized protein CEXT_702031 [Caerostris extrusa]
MRDSTIRRLVKKIFPQLWLKHKLISRIPSTCINSLNEIAVLSKIISETVLVYLHTYRPALNEYLNRNIPTMPRSRQKFWYHISFLCSQVFLVNDNIFDYFLTTCSITAEVALFCHAMNFDNVLPYASIFFTAFFEKELSHRFYSSGGWQGLKTYIENSCYNELYGIVNGYVKKINHPTELLPILITLKNENFAAERRKDCYHSKP